ncbi:hypothetical protein Slit_0341 [Sideroxydans lithotrophicus ES-1]|uniref:Uncharacterized protein n=1 Tax=Sideroxydans lithotrophicus (strain ES-1) TaxID=580332 RepID=D5CLJ5_SIDLE|nr:hypothetical protein Slit_0341 [Sideroxydans lithotrophicus ES-1]
MAITESLITCSTCGATYRLTMTRLTFRDKDSINCEVCGALLKNWNEAKSWSATLTMRGTPPNKTK